MTFLELPAPSAAACTSMLSTLVDLGLLLTQTEMVMCKVNAVQGREHGRRAPPPVCGGWLHHAAVASTSRARPPLAQSIAKPTWWTAWRM